MREFDIKTTVTEYDTVGDLPENYAELVMQARDIAGHAYTPYSGFSVGAALMLEDGTVITGSNQENAAYPSGSCAERVALFYANSRFPRLAVIAMAITGIGKDGQMADPPVYPCGACRQVMLESEMRSGKGMILIFDGKSRIHSVYCARELLPLSFDKYSLFQDRY